MQRCLLIRMMFERSPRQCAAFCWIQRWLARLRREEGRHREALEPLRRARDEGLDVSAGVSIHHLTLNELDVADYRTFFKVKPPLRAEEDRMAALMTAAAPSLTGEQCSRRRGSAKRPGS